MEMWSWLTAGSGRCWKQVCFSTSIAASCSWISAMRCVTLPATHRPRGLTIAVEDVEGALPEEEGEVSAESLDGMGGSLAVETT